MAINARFVFLPKPAKGLKFMRSQFQATYPKTLSDLERELSHLKAHSVTVQAGFPPERIRNDGWPYSSAGASSSHRQSRNRRRASGMRIVGREVKLEMNGRVYTGVITGFDNGNFTLTVEFEGDAV